AFILYPVHRWLTRAVGGRAGLSAAILTASTPFALLIPLVFLGIVFVNQARALVAYIKESNIHLDETMFANLEQYRIVGPLVRMAREQLSISGADMQEWLTNAAQALLHNVASFSGGFFLSAVGTLVAFFFMLFLLFFMIRDGSEMFATLQRLIPVPSGHREQLFTHLASVAREELLAMLRRHRDEPLQLREHLAAI